MPAFARVRVAGERDARCVYLAVPEEVSPTHGGGAPPSGHFGNGAGPGAEADPAAAQPPPDAATTSTLTVGRNPTCGLVFTDGHISTKHLTLEAKVDADSGSAVVLLHESSSNGTWVNARRLDRGDVLQLEDGDEIELPCADDEDKRNFTLVFELLRPSAAAAGTAGAAAATTAAGAAGEAAGAGAGGGAGAAPAGKERAGSVGSVGAQPPHPHPHPQQHRPLEQLQHLGSSNSIFSTSLVAPRGSESPRVVRRRLTHRANGGAHENVSVDWAWEVVHAQCEELAREAARLSATVHSNGGVAREMAEALARSAESKRRALELASKALASARDLCARLEALGVADSGERLEDLQRIESELLSLDGGGGGGGGGGAGAKAASGAASGGEGGGEGEAAQ